MKPYPDPRAITSFSLLGQDCQSQIFLRTNCFSQTHGHWEKTNEYVPFILLAPANVKLQFVCFFLLNS